MHVHLGMKGVWLPRPPDARPIPQARLRLALPDVAWELAASSRCELLGARPAAALVAALGPDPLRREADRASAVAALGSTGRAIGTALLDQSVVAGVGNVFRAEALRAVGLHPGTSARDLDAAALERLWEVLVTMMSRAVDDGRIVTVDARDRSAVPEAEARPQDARRSLRSGTTCPARGLHGEDAVHAVSRPTCPPRPEGSLLRMTTSASASGSLTSPGRGTGPDGRPEAGPEPARLTWALLALALGGFAIGTTEFVTMGLLPQVAAGVHVSIPTAGHLISAYALGVVVGAPVIAVLAARLPRRCLLIGLMTAYAAFNLLSAAAADYHVLLLARFLDGLPHGAYFGVASLVAAELAAPGRRGRAVAGVMLGLSVANVVGVPAATWLGQQVGWRAAYVSTAVIALATVVMVLALVPRRPGNPHATGRRELLFFRNGQALVTLFAGAVGFGGLFAVYSYIAPTVTEVGGLPDSAVPVFTAAFGLGMVAGTWLAGRLAEWSVFGSLLWSGAVSGLVMLAVWAAAPHGWLLLPAVFLVTAIGSVLVVNLQLRLMTVSGDAQTLGAAMNHASLNVANALGAWLGGLVIAAGHGYRAPALVGAALSVLGIVVLLWSAALHRRDVALRSAASRS